MPRRLMFARRRSALALGLALCVLALVGTSALAHGHDAGDTFHSSCAVCRWLSDAAPGLVLVIVAAVALPPAGTADAWRPALHPQIPGRHVRSRGPPLA